VEAVGQKRSDTVQTAVRLPREMFDRLRQSERGVSEEIRERIGRTFKEDTDPITQELIVGLLRLADAVRLDLGAAWHARKYPLEAFAAAVAQRLADYAATHDTGLGAADELFPFPQDPPEAVGRTLERQDQRSHSYEHLQAAQRRRSPLQSKHMRKKEDQS
jgi:hypothetical protein